MLSTAAFIVVFASMWAALLPVAGSRWSGVGLSWLDRFAGRRWSAIATCAAAGFVGSMLVAYLVAWPSPRVHDEFSYLLAAETFASGRLANVTHPLWQHFESFHIIQVPTYASKYPPAQGLVLAAGILLGGDPAVGLWLGAAAMCAAICWMLYGFCSPRWAFLGGLIATAQLGIATYWTQSYWGGAIAAAGGALVFGAAVRLATRFTLANGLWLGVGLVVLANSRPFEGAVTSVAAAGLLVLAWRRRREGAGAVALTVAAVLALGVTGMGVYNRAVTGSALTMPYVLHERTYVVRAPLTFQAAHSVPEYRHDVMREFYTGPIADLESGGEGAAADGSEAGSGSRALTRESVNALRGFFVGRALTIPFVVGALVAATALPGRLLLGVLLAGGLCLYVTPYFKLHYLAPVAGPALALIAFGLERIEPLRWREFAVGRAFCLAALAATAISLGLEVGRVPEIRTGSGLDDFCARRARVLETLRSEPGSDLVIVEYGPGHDANREWVYNAADIDGAEVVWARSMGSDADRRLREYFNGRKVWTFRDGFGAGIDGLRPYEG